MPTERVSISPKARQALRVEAALQNKKEYDLLSEMVLANVSEKTKTAIGL